jgi:hypothetical protein
MPQTLLNLSARLQSAVAPRNSVPGNYDQLVKDALTDLSRKVPMKKLITLAMQAGVATYALPADFLRVIQAMSLVNPLNVILAPQGIIPVNPQTWYEKWMIDGQSIKFYPVPQYSIARDVWYAAAYILDGSNIYQSLTDDLAEIAMLKAQALALGMQANREVQNAWSYGIGDERVSKEKLGSELQKQADALNAQYKTEITAAIGVIGKRAQYSPYERGGLLP